MGLAERFKKHIENKDLFETTEKQINSTGNSVKFISKPVNILEDFSIEVDDNVEDVQKSVLPKRKKTDDIIISHTTRGKNFNTSIFDITKSDLNVEFVTKEVLNKISKTPYWNEYSSSRKEKMVRKYFLKRLPEDDNSNVTNELINEILTKTTK